MACTSRPGPRASPPQPERPWSARSAAIPSRLRSWPALARHPDLSPRRPGDSALLAREHRLERLRGRLRQQARALLMIGALASLAANIAGAGPARASWPLRLYE